MKIKDLLISQDLKFYGDDEGVEVDIKGISYDSRNVKDGFAFFALDGHFTDGKKFISQALESGAALIISNEKIENLSVPQIVVKDVLSFMSEFSAKFYDYPDRKLKIIAITGTNGKTSISYMLESIFSAAGIECGVFGTINYRYKNKVINAPNTTPQSADLFLMMREMVDSGIKFLIMEVSSHSLALGRVADIEFDAAIFTNLTQDHLDFHENMENYFDAKTILFKQLGLLNTKKQKCAIINIDDDYGKKLAQINPQIKTFTYGTKDDDYDFKAENILISNFGSAFDFIVKDKKKERIEIKHIGAHNVYNALASLAAAIFCGVNFDIAVHAIKSAKQAPGRLERIENQGLGFDIFIDYAHTDDALKNVLSALKAINPTRIITVFGCGGDRDRLKRPKMGEVAAQMSDFVFITSDNPRTEDAHKIILDIEVGMKRFKSLAYKVVIDRKEAIAQAVTMCARGDVILIAGKGHEDYQIIGQEKIHFSDFQVASQCLNQRVKKKKTSKTKVMPQGEFDFGNN